MVSFNPRNARDQPREGGVRPARRKGSWRMLSPAEPLASGASPSAAEEAGGLQAKMRADARGKQDIQRVFINYRHASRFWYNKCRKPRNTAERSYAGLVLKDRRRWRWMSVWVSRPEPIKGGPISEGLMKDMRHGSAEARSPAVDPGRAAIVDRPGFGMPRAIRGSGRSGAQALRSIERIGRVPARREAEAAHAASPIALSRSASTEQLRIFKRPEGREERSAHPRPILPQNPQVRALGPKYPTGEAPRAPKRHEGEGARIAFPSREERISGPRAMHATRGGGREAPGAGDAGYQERPAGKPIAAMPLERRHAEVLAHRGAPCIQTRGKGGRAISIKRPARAEAPERERPAAPAKEAIASVPQSRSAACRDPEGGRADEKASRGRGLRPGAFAARKKGLVLKIASDMPSLPE